MSAILVVCSVNGQDFGLPTATIAQSAALDSDAAEVNRLLELRHPDPHAILGAHPSGAGVIIRALRPDATSVKVLAEHQASRAMRMVHPAGLFEAIFPDRTAVFEYQLEAAYPDGTIVHFRDPYSFLPSLGELDQHLWNEGQHLQIHHKLGAHRRLCQGAEGIAFAVWAPNARGVSVVGDFNGWDGRVHLMRLLGSSGIWELFLPDLAPGSRYKFEIRDAGGGFTIKADPFAAAAERPPATASLIYESAYDFSDNEWLEKRRQRDQVRSPIAIYEVHPGSWRRVPEEGDRPLNYRELAVALADYVQELGFTHVELLPVMEHPFTGSWGYQVTGFFAPTARHGDPDDFRFLVDYLHQRGIGLLLDWVPAHFPTDSFALGRFDGTALFEHLDPRRGHHPEWDTYIFNYGRNEVRNFLTASALAWLHDFHADGLRVDAVASMLYLDYGRQPGQWLPNRYGGHENLEASDFLKQLNEIVYRAEPGIAMVAEESTAWSGVSRPTYLGGLGFGFKWDMGWMPDTLNYFSQDSVHRRTIIRI
jgi:1,4-alpha-glucan branching enzyme